MAWRKPRISPGIVNVDSKTPMACPRMGLLHTCPRMGLLHTCPRMGLLHTETRRKWPPFSIAKSKYSRCMLVLCGFMMWINSQSHTVSLSQSNSWTYFDWIWYEVKVKLLDSSERYPKHWSIVLGDDCWAIQSHGKVGRTGFTARHRPCGPNWYRNTDCN